MNYVDHCRLPDLYEVTYKSEKAEIKISKYALLEALFQSKVWSAPYIRNPWIYITDNPKDFEGDKGVELQKYFKRVFFD